MAHVPVVREADGFVTCSCGVRCGSLYFQALHSEEQLDTTDRPGESHPTAWPAAHLQTVPRALWPQSGVIARNTHDLSATEYTTARVVDQGGGLDALRHALALVPALGRGNGDHACPVGCAMVALGARTLAALAVPYPEQLHPFAPKLSGDGVTELFPAGRNDVLLFVKSSTAECAAEATAAFVAVAGSVLEDIETTVGFLNDGRDLTGAIDGTKNPDATLRTVVEQASIGPRDYAGGAHLGGSFVFCSKFAHRLEDFRAMDAEHQASVFGRDLRKESPALGIDGRVENPKVAIDVKGSHVYRAWGEMYRQSMAFRDPSGCPEGLLFIAFSRKLQELEDALNRMCGNEEGQYGVGGERVRSPDNLFKFTSSLSADYFFAPSAPALAELAALRPSGATTSDVTVVLPPADGVTVRDKRCRSRFFAVCDNCKEEAAHTAEAGADVALCLLCHRLRPYREEGSVESQTAAI